MIKKIISLFVAFALCFSFTVSLSGCDNSGEENKTFDTVYSVVVESIGGMPLEDITVEIYKDAEMQNLQWAAETDGEGKITFDADSSKTYYAALKDVPDGYLVTSSYELNSENTKISLKTILGDATDMASATYKLGSVVHDFTVTATDGKDYKLSELLKTKKAVVLNFWFINCGPCEMEFPYLQQAYIDYQNEIALIAINPYDGTNDTVSAYAVENNLTFPMASTDSAWAEIMQLTAYPTTVVIDRYGTICFIHKGMVTSKEDFTKVFEFFTADDYKQTLIRNISEIQ